MEEERSICNDLPSHLPGLPHGKVKQRQATIGIIVSQPVDAGATSTPRPQAQALLDHRAEGMTAEYVRHRAGKRVKPARRMRNNAPDNGTVLLLHQ